MQVNVIIKSSDTNEKKINTTLTYVNQQATNQSLLALAQALNAFTTNIFLSATKEVKGEVL